MNACNKFSVFIDCAGYFIDALETIAYNFSIITFDALKSNSFFARCCVYSWYVLSCGI